MALSPRGLLHKTSPQSRHGFTCCVNCKARVEKGKVPTWAIINKKFVGGAPSCLTDLSEVELALLTPMQNYGYYFSYVGGKMMNLKGTLTFMRVKERKILEAVTQLEGMGLTDNVLLIRSEKMMDAQRKHVKEKGVVMVDKLIKAVD